METGSLRLPTFDAADPAVLADPYPRYAELRRAGPLARGGVGQWVVSRHADVAALLRDRRLGTEYPPEYHEFSNGTGPARDFFERIILDRDPPAHTRLRRLMGAAFSPRLVQRMERQIARVTAGLLGPLAERGRFDAVADLAFPLPVTVVCELLGIPAADRDLVRPKAVDLCLGFASVVPAHQRATVDAAVVWLRDYVGSLLDERRRVPREDLLSTLLAAEADGETLTREEIVDNAVFLFFAGFETTVNLIATGCAALLSHPDQWARLRGDRTLVGTAVEEFLRYDAPIQLTARLVREPVDVGGRTIRAGRVLVLLLGSANRDEHRFADPDRLDVGRSPNPHVSFGGGPHHCLGAVLARAEGRVVFEHLLARFAAIEPAGPAVRRRDATFRGLAGVPVAVRAA
ncbi:cytochrome P450 [Dactylosporangium sp. NPDC000244]|uniref:cytochrome P450 n=1 Tax=Dactylosporangium sp. NPDC000244 TaxID=3154365 RepID=UPI003324B208